jgi:hypothetical protein
MFSVPFLFKDAGGYSVTERNTQYNTGCQLVLTYEDTTHVRLKSTASSIKVILPDCSKDVEVTSTGFTSTFTGNVDTFYYVYLTTGPSLILSTTAPDTTYTNQQTLGTDKVLVGYAGLSATNTMSGVWNVYSFYGQEALTYSTNITTCTTTYAYSGTMNGLVVAPGKTASITRTGSNTLNLYAPAPWNSYYYYTQSGTVGIGSWTPPCADLTPYVNVSYYPQGYTFTIAKNYSDMTNGVFNVVNPGLTMTALTSIQMLCYLGGCGGRCSNPASWDTYATPTCSSASGAVTFTREGNI